MDNFTNKHLQDILNAINDIETFFDGQPKLFEEFCQDIRLQRAIERVNECASILDSYGNEVCIVKIEKVAIIQFQNITEAFAVEEGDGDLHNWLKIHTEYYTAQLEKIGKKLMGSTELVCEWFKVIWIAPSM